MEDDKDFYYNNPWKSTPYGGAGKEIIDVLDDGIKNLPEVKKKEEPKYISLIKWAAIFTGIWLAYRVVVK